MRGRLLELLLLLRLPASPEAAVAARHAVSGLHPYFDAAVLADAELLVSELVANAVRHGGLASRDSVEVSVRASPAALMGEVADRGRGFGGRRPGRREPAVPGSEEASGWGLFLVDRIATTWGISERPEVRVWFELRPGARNPGGRRVPSVHV